MLPVSIQRPNECPHFTMSAIERFHSVYEYKNNKHDIPPVVSNLFTRFPLISTITLTWTFKPWSNHNPHRNGVLSSRTSLSKVNLTPETFALTITISSLIEDVSTTVRILWYPAVTKMTGKVNSLPTISQVERSSMFKAIGATKKNRETLNERIHYRFVLKN